MIVINEYPNGRLLRGRQQVGSLPRHGQHHRQLTTTTTTISLRMPSLCTLPAEVLHLVLRYLNPCDIAAIRISCQDLNSYLQDNKLLYKELYLNNWVHRYLNSSYMVYV